MMQAHTLNEPQVREHKAKDRRIAGMVLIAVGLVALLGQFFSLGIWSLGLLALVFFVAGAINRSIGLIIPGGVLGGIALGAGLIEGPFANVADPLSGGIFLLSFAAGWVLITLMSLIFTDKVQYWPLIPAGVMAFIGGAIMLGESGEQALEVVFGSLNYLVPIGLILGGAYILLRRKRPNDE